MFGKEKGDQPGRTAEQDLDTADADDVVFATLQPPAQDWNGQLADGKEVGKRSQQRYPRSICAEK